MPEKITFEVLEIKIWNRESSLVVKSTEKLYISLPLNGNLEYTEEGFESKDGIRYILKGLHYMLELQEEF